MNHWCVQAGHPLPTQRTSFLGSEGEQADDLSTGSTPTGNVDGSFAFLVSCGEGLIIPANRLHAHQGKNMSVCLSFRCHPMMWQSSMLISLLVLSLEQIYVQIWVNHGSYYPVPITTLEQLVVLIGRHKGIDGSCGGFCKLCIGGEASLYVIFNKFCFLLFSIIFFLLLSR